MGRELGQLLAAARDTLMKLKCIDKMRHDVVQMNKVRSANGKIRFEPLNLTTSITVLTMIRFAVRMMMMMMIVMMMMMMKTTTTQMAATTTMVVN